MSTFRRINLLMLKCAGCLDNIGERVHTNNGDSEGMEEGLLVGAIVGNGNKEVIGASLGAIDGQSLGIRALGGTKGW